MPASARKSATKPAVAKSAPRKAAVGRKSPAARAPRPGAAPAAAPAVEAKQAAAAALPAQKEGADKPRKLKLVRDSFTMPKVEYGVIDILKTRAARLGRPSKKSDILRAGVKALEAMSDAQFLACVSALPPAAPARPPKA